MCERETHAYALANGNDAAQSKMVEGAALFTQQNAGACNMPDCQHSDKTDTLLLSKRHSDLFLFSYHTRFPRHRGRAVPDFA